MAPNRIYSIQALRAVAATGVVFAHAISRLTRTFPGSGDDSILTEPWLVSLGQVGVDVFFVISGFIMFYVHKNDFAAIAAPGRFMQRRLTRIVPLYWALTTLGVLLLAFAPSLFTYRSSIDLAWVLGSYLFIPVELDGLVAPVVGAGWTLNYEMFFYLTFAAALFFPRRAGLAIIVSLMLSLVALGFVFQPEHAVLSTVTDGLLIEFLMGIGIAALVERQRLKGAAIAAAIIAASPVIVWGAMIGAPEGDFRFLFWGVPAALIVYAVASIDLKNPGRLTTLAGDASYSIYLMQVFALPAIALVMRAVGLGALPFAANVVILTAGAVMAGIVCWYIVEMPLTKLAKMAWPSRKVLSRPLPVQ